MEYQLRAARPDDAAWVNILTKETMNPWVEAAWEAEEDRQHYYYLNRFNLETTRIIEVNGRSAGRISLEISEKTLNLADIHIAEEFQGHGLGTKIIKDKLAEAVKKGLDVELKCLRSNPVQNLYIRLGFKLILQDEKRLYYKYSVRNED
ncbi:MAG: GNAT family N-acetyltransferase [Spirochaetales bacterium]|uniref:GNAT family N-acetyltransferase n=1 Tax=Candidatus Thalassospirochaeta sargassi TaxID=3119039 RepID=A0AAJ1IFP3_9SPIO|nr:GNAT family N-acetyltransferase [Spirochaetales bacterium]